MGPISTYDVPLFFNGKVVFRLPCSQGSFRTTGVLSRQGLPSIRSCRHRSAKPHGEGIEDFRNIPIMKSMTSRQTSEERYFAYDQAVSLVCERL